MLRALSWASLYHLIVAEGDVEVLKDGTFDAFIKETERVLVKFYAPWCGHCKSMAPEFVSAAAAMKEEGLKSRLADVDATEEKELASRFGVSGYPTLKYFVSGTPSDYNGPRQKDGIVSWMRSREQPILMDITADEVEEKKSDDSSSFIVTAKLKMNSVRYKVLLGAAEKLRDAEKNDPFRFYYVPLAKGQDAKKDASMELVNHKTGDTIKYTKAWNKDNAFKWLLTSAYGEVSHYDDKIHTVSFLSEAYYDTVYVAVYEKDDEKDALVAELEVLAKKYAKIKFCHAPLEEVKDTDGWGLQQSGIMLLQADNKKYRQLGLAKHEDFIKGVETKKIKRHFKSTPAEPEEDGVTVLTGDNFEKIALDSKKDVFVEFYAPWCGHCKALAPKWVELAKKIKDKGFSDKVIIAKLDATANETEEQVSGFPTLVFYPASKRSATKKEKFDGNREVEPMYDFILEKAVNLEGYEEGGSKKGKKYSMVERELEKKRKKEEL